MNDWIIALSIGLIGSFHCIGMCGPIAIALPLKNDNWFTRILSGFVYNTGRILTYGLIGFMFGLLGKGIQLAGFQRWASIILGIVMIISVFFPYFLRQKFTLSRIYSGYALRLTSNLKKLFSQKTSFSLFLIGLLNGLLPCGLVYVAVAGAINTNNVQEGIIFMILFGLGTIPMMLLVSLVGNIISVNFRRSISKVIPYFIVFLGILFIIRGMSLGIPFVSPKAEKLVPHQIVKEKNCCQ